MNYTIINNDSLLALEELEENSIDSIVTDPPYELNFMNKGWDNAGVSFNKDTWKKCLRVLKPGGYLLAFGGSRTFHRIACAIEDAGFEIRDTIMWLYGSGFPKSMNIGIAIDKKNGLESEKWKGWGTALKPSFEPIIVARKPFRGSLVDNVIEYGVGGINIDECRVGSEERFNQPAVPKKGTFNCSFDNDYKGQVVNGRFPANTILSYDDTDLDNKSWLRYFYCAKASKKDRDKGLEEFEEIAGGSYQFIQDGSLDGKIPIRKNTHPTVKPTALMQYLIRLVTPKGGTILDPFMGSGSTGKAAMYENKERESNYKFIGIEKEKEYCEIAEARINYVIR